MDADDLGLSRCITFDEKPRLLSRVVNKPTRLMGETVGATTGFRRVNEVVMHAVRAAATRVVELLKEVGRMLRIILFLHSARDFSSVLRPYGMGDYSRDE